MSVAIETPLLAGGVRGRPQLIPGSPLEELFAAWKRTSKKLDAIYERAEAGGWSPEHEEDLNFVGDAQAQIERAMWETRISTLDELKMMAEVEFSYAGSHDYSGVFGEAAFRILGPHQPTERPPDAPFSPPNVTRVGHKKED